MIKTTVTPVSRDVALFFEGIPPRERSLRFAELAADHINDAKATNTRALGREPSSKTFVDGKAGAPLTDVRPDGVIVTEFELLTDVLIFIGQNIEQFSPVKRGRYRRSHVLLADGAPMNITTPTLTPQIAAAEEFVFINTAPYARKIERGSSQQAPDGVYQAVANLARRKFGRVGRITFSYRTLAGGQRNPSIIVRMR